MDDVSPGQYAVLGLGSLAYAAFMLCWFLHAAFLQPISGDLGLSNTQAGVLVGSVPATYVFLSLASGAAVDRIGPRRAVAAALGLVGVTQVLRGLAPNYPSLLAATVVFAVGGTGITFGLPKLVSGLFPSRRLGTASTVYILGSQAGAAAAYAFGRPVLGPALGGWRGALVWTGAATVLFGLVWVVTVTWHARERPALYPGVQEDAGGLASFRRDVVRVFDSRAMRLLAVVGFTYLLLVHGLRGWLPTLIESRTASETIAAGVATAFVVGQAAGAVVVPPISDRLRTRRGAVAGSGIAAALGIIGVYLPLSVPLTLGAVLLAGVGVGGVSPLVRAIPTELDGIGPALTGTAVGMVFAVGQVGGFAGPFLVGALVDYSGSFVPGLAVLGAGALVMFAAGTMLPPVARS